jgi:hypothetical protein
MTAENVTAFVVLILIFGTGIAIAVSIAWFDHRTRWKALEVLRVYAQRGEEPPPSVTQALTWVSGWPRKAPDPTDYTRDRLGRPVTRGGYLTHAAANAVFAAGFSGFVWWRYSDVGEASTGVMIAIFVGLFFAASVAAQLVGAYYAPDR